jgi:hypothetical protein
MAKNETRRLLKKKITEDTNSFSALENIPAYAPANPTYDVAAGMAKQAAMQKAQAAEAQIEAARKAARDNAVAAEWDFHNFMLGAKLQVAAQFGDSSNELQALGLKKKSEYKTPKRKTE